MIPIQPPGYERIVLPTPHKPLQVTRVSRILSVGRILPSEASLMQPPNRHCSGTIYPPGWLSEIYWNDYEDAQEQRKCVYRCGMDEFSSNPARCYICKVEYFGNREMYFSGRTPTEALVNLLKYREQITGVPLLPNATVNGDYFFCIFGANVIQILTMMWKKAKNRYMEVLARIPKSKITKVYPKSDLERLNSYALFAKYYANQDIGEVEDVIIDGPIKLNSTDDEDEDDMFDEDDE